VPKRYHVEAKRRFNRAIAMERYEDAQKELTVRWTPIVGQFPGKNKVVDVLRLFVVLFLPFEII
jgi:hypothetical protein